MLAAQMTAIIPDGFRVDSADGMLWYSAEEGRFPGQSGDYQQPGCSGTAVRVNLEGGSRADDSALARIAALALDDLQDYIDEATHEPWPAQRGIRRGHLHRYATRGCTCGTAVRISTRQRCCRASTYRSLT